MLKKFFVAAIAWAAVIAVEPAIAADWIVVENSVEVDKPVDATWKRIGDFCEISEWMKVSCTYALGHGDLGSIRVLNNANQEVMVAKTAHSYTYWQNVGNMAPASFHGTLMAEAGRNGKTTLAYTLVYDQSGLPEDKRASEHARLQGRFHQLLEVMKNLAEVR
jgi:hypothetical protein